MTEPASFMARFGARLIATGYAIVPIQPGTKKPGCYHRGQWRDYPDWTRHAHRATTELELAQWSSWPDAGIGVVGGPVAAIDIDIAGDTGWAHRIEALARARLGDTPALRIGLPPKRLLVYRAATPFKGIRRHPLEVLCLGQQFVAYAVHPATGRPYDWPEEQLADIDRERLPVITEDQARAFLDEAIALLPAGMVPVTLAAGNASDPGGNGVPHGTPAAVQAALAFIPNAELDYDSWVRIGLALKGALGEAGADLFAAWSAQAAKNDPAVTAKAWAGFKPRSIGAGTLYHLAMERGWKPDPSLVLDGTAPHTDAHPAAGLLAKMQGPSAQSAPAIPTLPPQPALDRLDGALALLVRHILATAIRPQPWLAVGAALAMLGAVMGRKVRTPTNLRSNLYVLGIAESGGGKDHARKVIKDILVQAGLAQHLGGERLASGAGLITALTRQPAALFQIDEFGRFLANVIDKRRAPKHLSEIWDLFTELATSASTTFLGAEYADQRERPRQDIIEPCACVHGVSAPGTVWEALRSGTLEDGSLARFLVFRSEEDIPDRNRQAGATSQPAAELLDAVRRVAAVGSGAAGNLVATGAPNVPPAPLIVPMDDEALAIFDALDVEMTQRQRAAAGSERSAVLARVWENTAKVALIKAVSANPDQPVIRAVDAEWARDVVAHCVVTLLLQAERHLADNETERNHKRVLEIIRREGADGISKKALYDRTRFLSRRDRDDIIATLVESENIALVVRKTATKPMLSYCLVHP